jgi:small subunit ribosomal protein S6
LNDYELVTILHPDIKDEDVGDTVERLNQFITGRGGEVREVDQWGRRRLAYPIARQFEGSYVVSHLQMQPANAAELEANLRISEDVLRHLLVRYSPAERAAALAAMQRRRPRSTSRTARPRRPKREPPDRSQLRQRRRKPRPRSPRVPPLPRCR